MKRTTSFLLILVLSNALTAYAQDDRKDKVKPVQPVRQAVPPRKAPPAKKPGLIRGAAPARPAQPVRPAAPARPSVVINLNRPSAGRNNRAFQPVPQPTVRPQNPAPVRPQPDSRLAPQAAQPPSRQAPSLQPAGGRPQAAQPPAHQAPPPQPARGRPQAAPPAIRAANAVHHQPYTPGYVRKKLQNLGVKASPRVITDRAEIVATDRKHSAVRLPLKGPDNRSLMAKQVTARHLNDTVVRKQITLVNGEDYRRRILEDNARETKPNQYYWHHDNGFDYCHTIDSSGYHWYGWYTGDQFFWTRNYAGRWWSYDSDFGRWNFWNDGYWWWQDPNHIGDLYCYTDGGYIPANSADDPIVVASTDQAGGVSYNAPDGSRTIKVFGDSKDAFLYDTADPPTFDPVYLASGVLSLEFSDTGNGRALEIILKLQDGSFDMFDAQGHPYNAAGPVE